MPHNKKILFLCLFLLLPLFLCGCRRTVPPENIPDGLENSLLDRLADEAAAHELASDPIGLHYLMADPESYGISPEAALPTGLNDPADEKSVYEQYRSRLLSLDRAKLTKDRQLTRDIFLWWLDTQLQAYSCPSYAEPFSPYSGFHVQLPVLLAEYSFRSEEDVEAYFHILQQLPAYFDTLIAWENRKLQEGTFMSLPALQAVLDSCRRICASEASPLLETSFEERIAGLSALSDTQRGKLLQKNKEQLRLFFYPSYQKLLDFLLPLQSEAPEAQGLAARKDGLSYYEYLIRSYCGTDKNYQEYLALAEKDLRTQLSELHAFYQSLTLPGTEELPLSFFLTVPEEILADLTGKCRSDYPPLSSLNCRICYVSPALEEYTSPAFYLISPMDCPEDNTIYINQSRSTPSLLYPLLAHEGIPGHMYQQIYFSSYCQIPLRHILAFPGYTEGWASYAEQDSYYLGETNSADSAQLAQLQSSADLALSALIDLKVNGEGCDLPALTAALQTYLPGILSHDLEKIYLYVTSEPGVYLKYYGGYREFLLLRSRCEDALGSRFSPRDFHKVILETGDCPFPVLEKELDSWVLSCLVQ